jgi:flavin reductase (DIM6/NTAB) family NADH-FMN oxidoreductase RutF
VRFEPVHGVPLLECSVARMANEIVARHDCGDHTIFVGHILAMECSDRAPLIYYRGSFGGLTHFVPEEEVPVPEFW